MISTVGEERGENPNGAGSSHPVGASAAEAAAAATPLSVLIIRGGGEVGRQIRAALVASGRPVRPAGIEDLGELDAVLAGSRWDLAICCARGDGESTIAAVRAIAQRSTLVPVVVVAEHPGAGEAVRCMRAGACDYLPADGLDRLDAAVAGAIEVCAARAARAQSQEQLAVAERLASMGLLAAGLAHEINNPLSALMASLEFAGHLLRKDDEGARLRLDSTLGDAREACARIASILRDVKTFARPESSRIGVVELHEVIDAAARLARFELRVRAKLVRDYGDIPPVTGDEARLGQVFLNLLVNAAQAIPQNSRDDHEVRITTRLDGNGCVVAEIRDSGDGMDAPTLSRVFDEFFTTKSDGTGLGLPISRRIVREVGGELSAESERGRGSVFRVVLPAARVEATVQPPAAPAGRPRASSAHILVVDDDRMVRRAIARILEPEHAVELAATAEEALDQFRDGRRFDVVLCDVMLPGMSGIELHARVNELDAAQAEHMLFMTGGTRGPRAAEFYDRMAHRWLEKPFTPNDLRRAVSAAVR